MKTKDYILESLNINSVNVVIETSAEIDGEMYTLGRARKSYSNSSYGRELIKKELPTNYYNAIMTIWGENSTVKDPENINALNN